MDCLAVAHGLALDPIPTEHRIEPKSHEPAAGREEILFRSRQDAGLSCLFGKAFSRSSKGCLEDLSVLLGDLDGIDDIGLLTLRPDFKRRGKVDDGEAVARNN